MLVRQSRFEQQAKENDPRFSKIMDMIFGGFFWGCDHIENTFWDYSMIGENYIIVVILRNMIKSNMNWNVPSVVKFLWPRKSWKIFKIPLNVSSANEVHDANLRFKSFKWTKSENSSIQNWITSLAIKMREFCNRCITKVHMFRECQKILRNLPLTGPSEGLKIWVCQ